MPDDPTSERLLVSEVLAERYEGMLADVAIRAGMLTGEVCPKVDDVGPEMVAALLACFPDAPYGVTIRPDGTLEEAIPPMEELGRLIDDDLVPPESVAFYYADEDIVDCPIVYRPLPAAPEGDEQP